MIEYSFSAFTYLRQSLSPSAQQITKDQSHDLSGHQSLFGRGGIFLQS